MIKCCSILRVERIRTSIVITILVLFFSACLSLPSPVPKSKHVSSSKIPAELKVTYLGNSTLAFESEEAGFIVDGFVSRPGRESLFQGIKPVRNKVQGLFDRSGIKNIKAVIPLHSHYDHFMDAPAVACYYGADLIGTRTSKVLAESLSKCSCEKEQEMKFIELAHEPGLAKTNGGQGLT